MSSIDKYLEQQVLVLLHDGRLIAGQLKGTDVHTNIILANAVERLFAVDEPVEMVPLGLYLIRGENIALVGEIDADKDGSFDFAAARAEPIDSIHF